MELRKCENGHFYNGELYDECPTCKAMKSQEGHTVPLGDGGFAAGGQDTGHTAPLGGGFSVGGQDEGHTMPLGDGGFQMGGQDTGHTMPLGGGDPGHTRPLANGATAPLTGGFVKPQGGPGRADSGHTIAVVQQEMGIDPVVGWLVCLNGKEKGRDYRIHSDNNFVGRSEKMDICVRGDDTISRENHAVISYDMVDKCFYLSRGEGRSIIRLNGKAMLTSERLEAYDVLEVGRTRLLFIPMCGERFEWSNDEE